MTVCAHSSPRSQASLPRRSSMARWACFQASSFGVGCQSMPTIVAPSHITAPTLRLSGTDTKRARMVLHITQHPFCVAARPGPSASRSSRLLRVLRIDRRSGHRRLPPNRPLCFRQPALCRAERCPMDRRYHPRVLRIFPVTASDGRKYLDVVTDLMREPPGPEPRVLSEIKSWAAGYRDSHYPGRAIRYDWEANV